MALHTPYRHPALEALLEQFRQSAAQRDLAGGHAGAEKQQLRAAKLLNLSIPKAYGGDQLPWPQLYKIIRRLAEVDSALAHVLAFHHLQVITVLIYADAEQQQALLTPTAAEGLWWGNAMNPLDQRLIAKPNDEGYELNGAKGFCSGTRGSDWMTISAHLPDAPYPLLAVVPTACVKQLDDWNPIGQRQTDSISVALDQVRIGAEWVIKQPHSAPTAAHSLRNCFAQLVLVNLYLGIAQGALDEGCLFMAEQTRPWLSSGVERRIDDPFQQQRVGLLDAQISGAAAQADVAAALVQQAFDLGSALSADERGEVSIAICRAKALAHQAALSASEALFEMTGAKGCDQRYGFDRFWRNARTHTLHDPIDYKLKQIGQWRLTGQWPNPQHYS